MKFSISRYVVGLSWALVGSCLIISTVFATELSERTDAEGVQAVYSAIRNRLAPAMVRLETMGGAERVGNVNAIRETTGIHVTADGNHLSSAVAFAHEPNAVAAVFANGERRNAKIVCTDAKRKITLLKIDMPTKNTPFSAPATASIEKTRVGQNVLALGRVLNPNSVSIATGIVSGKNRRHGLALQTDAHVSPDNYGGPLVNLDGEVLGILTPFGMGENELLTGVDFYDSGVAFAIPLEDLIALLPKMKSATEKGNRELFAAPKIGLIFRNPTAILATTEILHVAEKSLAEKAGIQVGDVITHVDGKPIHRAVEFQQILAQHYAGETITLSLSRENATREMKILLEKQE